MSQVFQESLVLFSLAVTKEETWQKKLKLVAAFSSHKFVLGVALPDIWFEC